jgi:protein-arginine kinase activator protein McsA
MLRQMRDSLAPKLPIKEAAPKTAKGRKAELKQQLEEAIAKEDYEEAARLRDEIKKLKE